MLFSMKPVSRFHLIYVGSLLRVFSSALRAPLAKIKPFLSIYFRFSAISHFLTCLFRKKTSIGILLIGLFLKTQFAVKMSLVAAFNQKLPTVVLAKLHQSGAPLFELRTKSKMCAEHFSSYWLKNYVSSVYSFLRIDQCPKLDNIHQAL